MPTGIASLDPILDGGVPPGSVMLLLGDLGAGNYEFTYSSIVNSLRLMKAGASDKVITPHEIRYITFTRIKDDVRQEIVSSFHIADLEALVDTIQFDDLSELYFDNSVVPDEWYSHSNVITRLQKRASQDSLLVQLANVINNINPGSLLILDSVTDIATQNSVPNFWSNLTGFLRGLQRISKQRGITTYLLLSRGILDSSQERELADIADAVLLFKWEETTGARRQRVMYFEKFRGVMPHLEERDLVKFAVKISTTGGFEVSNIRVII
ncbi:MAG TPA: ATPase domain-containing protein [Methanoregula sp.]|nr:ATPase domain-containing protein [Methanoregula sp.]